MIKLFIIGTCTRCGSGQDTIAKELSKKLDLPIHCMNDKIYEIAKKNNLKYTRKNLQNIRKEYTEKYGSNYFSEILAKKIKKENKNVIITGIKLVEEINTFKKYFKHNFHLIFIQANEKTRYCRLINQNEKKDPKIRPDSINQMTNEKKLSEFEKLEQISELQIKCSITLEQLKKDTNKIIQKLLFLNDPKKAHIINEKTLYNGKIFETITQEWVIESNNNKTNTINIEIVRRSPGVRAIAIKDNKILLNREYRLEHDGFDYRLPGGKVFDTLEEYTDKSDTDIIKHASDAVKKELLEEAGLVAKTVNYINCTKAGATIIWDLYYFEIPDFEISKNGKNLEENEIIHSEWKSLDEVEQMCINGDIQEDRSIGVLLRYLKKTSSK